MKTFKFYIITTLFFGVIVAAATGEFALSIICSAIVMGVIFLILGNVYKKGKVEREKEQKEFEEKLTNNQEEYEKYSNMYDKLLKKYKSSDCFYTIIDDEYGIEMDVRHFSIIDNKLHVIDSKKPLSFIVKYENEIIPDKLEEKIYDLDDVKYYKIDDTTEVRQYITGGGGGGSSMSGALIGGAIGGTAGAIIGSREKTNEIKTTYGMRGSRDFILVLKNGKKVKLTGGKYIEGLYEWFLDVIPEKDYDNYIENKKAKGRN